MRFIIHEQPYERPLFAGQLRYELDGRPTGALESWRLTEAVDGYRFLRVDLDARDAPSGRSTIYHATLNPSGVLEQLKFRFWGEGLESSGTLVREGEEWVLARTVNNDHYEEVARGVVLWFPSGAGLSLLRGTVGHVSAVTLSTEMSGPAAAMGLQAVEAMVSARPEEPLEVDGGVIAVRPLTVTWSNHTRTVWLDKDGRPLRVWRDDGLLATGTHLVSYGR